MSGDAAEQMIQLCEKAEDDAVGMSAPPTPLATRRLLHRHRLQSSEDTDTNESPLSTPRRIRRKFQSLGDVLRCGSALPTVESTQFAQNDDNNPMGSQCVKRKTSSSSPYSQPKSRGAKSEWNGMTSRVLFADSRLSSATPARSTVSPLSTSTDNRSVSPFSAPSSAQNSPKTQRTPRFWRTLTKQIRERSRDRLQKVQPKKSLFRKISAGAGELSQKSKKEKNGPTSQCFPASSKNKVADQSVYYEDTIESTEESRRRRGMLRSLFRRNPYEIISPPVLDEHGRPVFTRRHRVEEEEADEEGDFVTFRLRIHLKEGHGLVIRDASGSSDPYVKFKYNEKTVYKSATVFRSLNPNWDEDFSFLISDPTLKFEMEVYDYDRFMSDDFMGAGRVDLSLLKLFEKHQIEVHLEGGEGSNEDYMGFLTMEIEITPMTEKQKDLFNTRAVRGVVSESMKRNTKSASVWLSAVNVVLVEARLNPSPRASNTQPPDVFAKLKLNSEKCKSKVATKTYAPQWAEPFDLHIYDESNQVLDVMLRDKNSVLGKCAIDLSTFERDRTKERWYQLDEDAGAVLLLITVSGTSASTVVANLNEYTGNRDVIINKYGFHNSLRNVKDVGHLTVKVYRAENLAAADIGGKSDPFCVLELVNARLQTPTMYKTLNPVWDKLFTFAVKDIHEVLEITVYDEDPNKKFEFLGKIAIPLMKIRNCEKRWYGLKDRKMRIAVKGRILLEMDVLWNPVKAAIRTFKPRERKFLAQEQRFKRAILVNNVNRLKEFYLNALDYRDFVQGCLSWESYPRSFLAMTFFMLFVHFFELWQLPVLLLALFAKAHVRQRFAESYDARLRAPSTGDREISPALKYETDDEEDSIETNFRPNRLRKTNSDAPNLDRSRSASNLGGSMKNNNNDKSTTIRGRITAIQDTLTLVQNSLDFFASLLERVRNTFNFTVPYLSYLAIFVLCVATILLYFIPFRWIVMAWGFNKFTKKLRNPHYVDNNELLDFLSRVPSDQELKNVRELRSNCEDRRPSVMGRQTPLNSVSSTTNLTNGNLKK